MAEQKRQQSQGGSKQRSQGGGRKANSEPRVQVFQQFGGCNFQLSPREFTLGKTDNLIDYDGMEQTDLQMNYVVVQNNVSVTDNKTLEARSNLVELFSAPAGKKLTGESLLVAGELYTALDDGTLAYGTIGSDGDLSSSVSLIDKAGKGDGHTWTGLAYVDNKLVGTTKQNQIWVGDMGTHSIENARPVPDPDPPTIHNVKARGKATINEGKATDECPHRIGICWAYINKFGPTNKSGLYSFYCSTTVSEMSGRQYLRIQGEAPKGYDIEAVEIYYVTGNASQPQFAGRVDFAGENGGQWTFDWFGYLDSTSMWPMANLVAPTDNYTEGVKASRITCIDGRLYFYGCANEPYRLYIGGNSGNLFSTAIGTGGGFVDVEPGSGQEIRYVDKYKTQSGNSIVTMLCDNDNSSKEQRYNLVENTVTISNESSMKSWQAEQVAGAVGCKSFDGAKVCEDGLYSVSRYGLALTTMTMEYNSQIRANYVSGPIKPAFTGKLGNRLDNASLIEADGVLYLAFGNEEEKGLDNMLFCYDIDLQAWWTVTLDIGETILELIHIDWEGYREGIGIVTPGHVYMLPLTEEDDPSVPAEFEVTIQTGELSTTQPQQAWQYLSQLEFRFDWFIGEMLVHLDAIDQFGREVHVAKTIRHDETVYDLAEWMRVDLRVQSYRLRMEGKCRFRLTHFMAKVYTMSSKVGLVWGFNDSMSYRSKGDIHPTFKDYNDIKRAIIP